MRVIAGIYKKRQLKVPKSHLTRPTTDKNKENLFNMIGPYFDGGVVSSVSVWVSHKFSLDRINEICDFIIENKTLNEIVPNSDVVFRPDK